MALSPGPSSEPSEPAKIDSSQGPVRQPSEAALKESGVPTVGAIGMALEDEVAPLRIQKNVPEEATFDVQFKGALALLADVILSPKNTTGQIRDFVYQLFDQLRPGLKSSRQKIIDLAFKQAVNRTTNSDLGSLLERFHLSLGVNATNREVRNFFGEACKRLSLDQLRSIHPHFQKETKLLRVVNYYIGLAEKREKELSVEKAKVAAKTREQLEGVEEVGFFGRLRQRVSSLLSLNTDFVDGANENPSVA